MRSYRSGAYLLGYCRPRMGISSPSPSANALLNSLGFSQVKSAPWMIRSALLSFCVSLSPVSTGRSCLFGSGSRVSCRTRFCTGGVAWLISLSSSLLSSNSGTSDGLGALRLLLRLLAESGGGVKWPFLSFLISSARPCDALLLDAVALLVRLETPWEEVCTGFGGCEEDLGLGLGWVGTVVTLRIIVGFGAPANMAAKNMLDERHSDGPETLKIKM